MNFYVSLRVFFGGTLGTCKTAPTDLELKDDAKPVCLQPYPVPSVKDAIFKEEVKILVKLGVLEEANDSKWGVPLFYPPEAKTNPVRLLKNVWELNRQLKRKPYPMKKICEIIINS